MHLLRTLIFIIAVTPFGFAVASADLNDSLTLDDARHLLSRTGFGASAHELNQLIGQSKSKAISSIVTNLSTSTATPVPDWINQPAPHHWARNQLSKTARREFNEARYREIESLRLWWVSEMIQTPSPQTERLVLAWHNHFATGYTNINDQAITIARQHMMFRELGSGNFRTLLKAIIRDPAMLNYLDNDNSRKQAPNENLARELMELFSLGEGNYTEKDIKNAARALTGNSTAPTHNLLFQFKPGKHDTSNKTLFGNSGNFNGDDVVDQILAQPAAAEFIATKFWKMLVSDKPPTQQQIEPLANKFRASDYDIKTLYRATLESNEFWTADNRATIVRSPVSLTIGTIRSTGRVPGTWQILPNILNQLGQQLFDPPNVAGWPGSRAWITPSRLLNRLEWLRSLDKNCDNADCNSSMMVSMSDMGNPAMQMTDNMAANEPNMGSSSDLVIRMASEEFDGPAVYQVTLTRGDMILWTSGETPLTGGHDTKRYGRIKRSKELPWRNVAFTLPENARKFDTIEIEYLNDKNQAGAEQNLFVDWATFNQKYYNADNGEQTNQCPNRKNARHGNLLCNGKVRLGKSTSANSAAAENDSDTLSVGGLFLWGIVSPDSRKGRKRFSNISFTLTDVKLDSRKWHSLTVLYGYSPKDKQYSLRLNNYGCWPDCVEQWPTCNATSADESGMQRLAIALTPKNKAYCPYDSLTDADKKLVNTLWQHLPQFYQQTEDSPKLNRQAISKAYEAWSPHVAKIDRIFQRKHQRSVSSAEASATLHISDQPNMQTRASRYIPQPPLPAGRSTAQQQQDMQTLITNNPDANLATLLLPDGASPRDARNLSLQEVLTDLAFQLK